jgi:hypothetical protein
MSALPRARRALAMTLGALSALAGCSDGDGGSCGPDGAPAGDLAVVPAGGAATLRFRGLRARPNNDCPAADAPAGVVSLTISGIEADGASPFTLCVPRPDLLNGVRQLGDEVQVVDVIGEGGGCRYRQVRTGTIATGTATGSGVCDNGRAAAGFALELDGQLQLERTCGAATDVVTATISGKVAVVQSDT